ncbi:hypothetical protein GSI_02393 [Ganoderma sinense ZZ0214-1]|uniref:MYND-type domain-containing protein n=1 Tax=Ganoderma sinense ZZ0214-1 TaxID=1077348 RepID=A0A2G8SPL1_9APHY|nr:hypothetical protein GSI_02393 [Ganoderma sinense ZZ0214-1]
MRPEVAARHRSVRAPKYLVRPWFAAALGKDQATVTKWHNHYYVNVRFADPIFYHGQRHGLGAWISLSSSMDCELSTLAYPMCPQNDGDIQLYLSDAEADPATSLQYKAHASSLLTLQVLVQNRRKDGRPTIIFGAQSELITSAEAIDETHWGSPRLARNGERMVKFPVYSSVRYCGTACQTADYLEGHQQECLGFYDPPFTTVFLTTPIGQARYAVDPLFGRGDRDGICVWLSVRGAIDCALSQLVYPLRPQSDGAETRGQLRRAEADAATSLKYRVHANSLLTLVQNRRKDGRSAILFGAQSQVIVCADGVDGVLRGSPGQDVERFAKFKVFTGTPDEMEVGALGIAHDPWDMSPRMYVKNFNGTELHPDNPLPPAIHNEPRGIFELHPGEYVLLHLQFRVGDGRNAGINKDFTALSNLFGLALPLRSPWNPNHDPAALDADLDARFWEDGAFRIGLLAELDRDAIKAYYRDYLYDGEFAHIESHYGRTHLKMWEQRSRDAGIMGLQEYRRTRGATQRGFDLHQEQLRRAGASSEDQGDSMVSLLQRMAAGEMCTSER